IIYICLFFFSSRRRHTRSKRDWSSDVCSSDLDVVSSKRIEDVHIVHQSFQEDIVALKPPKHFETYDKLLIESVVQTDRILEEARSEERRVGKECRSWWSRNRYKNKARGCRAGR